MLFNEEVIQLAWISLSAAFIKGRHSQAIRDTRRSAGCSGDTGWRDGGGGGGGGQIVKQIRRGGGNEQEVKKREKGEMRPLRRKSSSETMQTEMAGGLHSSLAPLLCS